ncbi:MAG: 1-acyl-sn-glycerol-3-phosphate acyltransferase [Spirochaetes bacterium]|nr:1-acyl-sn-glycerol-3-phosphate acyltransferase [Spirochaetota bacterium]
MKKNKLLIARLIIALFVWTLVFFIGLFIPRRFQFNTLWPIFSKMFLFAAKIDPYYIGKFDIKRSRNIIYLINHRSFADSFIITNFLRKPFTLVYISWMTKNPFFKFLTDKMGLISIPHNNLIEQKKSLSKIQKMLKKKYSLIYFPEGRFVYDKPIGELRKGIVQIAKQVDCLIVPLVIYGSGRDKDFLYEKKLIWKKIYMDSGKPVKYKDFKNDKSFIFELTLSMKNLYINLEKKYSN